MKNYKEFKKIHLGSSDIAALTMVGFKHNIGATAELLTFNEDGDYSAYLVDKDVKIKVTTIK